MTRITARNALGARMRASMRVFDAGMAPLKETREYILDKIRRELETADAYCQHYSNGEFISSSFIIGKSLKAISGDELELDGASKAAYFDADKGWWWREGGCWD